MSALLTTFRSKPNKGFTLIELLVVISIIAILSMVGLAAFQGVRARAQDVRIKSDLNAIKKAYEANYDPTINGGQGGYKTLSPSGDGTTSPYFAGGKIPTQPNGSQYTYVYGPDAAIPNNKPDGYKVTLTTGTTLSDNTTPTVVSNQGTKSATELNSCDPGGILSNGLMGYWRMDENSWTNDCSTLSVVNSVGSNGGKSCPAGTGPTGGAAGAFANSGKSGSFDGNDNVFLSSGISFSGFTGFSISAWIKPTSTGSRQDIFNNGHGVEFGINSGSLNVQLRDNNGGFPRWTGASGGVITTSWKHVAMTYTRSSNYKLYVNGSMVTQNTQGADYAHSGDAKTYIGNSNIGFGNFPYNGQIDDLRVYNKTLSDSDINLLYNSGQGCFP